MIWEYKIILKEYFFSSLSQENADAEVEWLNELGKDGWELYLYKSLNNGKDKYCFKRLKNT